MTPLVPPLAVAGEAEPRPRPGTIEPGPMVTVTSGMRSGGEVWSGGRAMSDMIIAASGGRAMSDMIIAASGGRALSDMIIAASGGTALSGTARSAGVAARSDIARSD